MPCLIQAVFKQQDSLNGQLQELEQALQNSALGQERQRFEQDLAPTRLGVVVRPKFFNMVVLQPSCSIVDQPQSISSFPRVMAV